MVMTTRPSAFHAWKFLMKYMNNKQIASAGPSYKLYDSRTFNRFIALSYGLHNYYNSL